MQLVIVKRSTINIAHKKTKFCRDSNDDGDEVGDEVVVDEYVDQDNVEYGNVDHGNDNDNGNVDHGNDNDNGNADHGDEVGDEDVVARVREVCSQLRRAELGHQQLKS